MPNLQADLELAQGAARGDEESWRRIVRKTRRSLLLTLISCLSVREDAVDLLQETYLLAVRHIDQYRGEATLLAWLQAIAHRRLVDWVRSDRARLRRKVAWCRDQEEAEALLRPAEQQEFLRALTPALALLPRAQRTALILRSAYGMSHREVAEIIGCSESAARVHYTRARRRVRGMLA
jgi:RNA polymerase sigma-70 factor, ECF subfamily